MCWDERKEILEAMSCIDNIYSFNDEDDSACDLIRHVLEENKNNKNVKIYFGNGGERTDMNSPEVDYCSENNIDTLWGVGGKKIQSSSDLLKGTQN